MSDLALAGNMPQILELEKIILSCEQVELPVKHHHIQGVYVREMFIPAGTVLTGKIHNKENISILAQGTIRVTNGTDSMRITAPHVMVDQPGIKRLGYAETDVTFINVLRSDKTTVEELEKELVSDTFEEYEQQKLLGVDA
ncbi:MAG: hypothetical protein ACXWAT_00090 [Methylobacter sp.]